TARQILLQRRLGLATPRYFHCELMRDEAGVRLAKRHDALSLRALREAGCTPAEVIARLNLGSSTQSSRCCGQAPTDVPLPEFRETLVTNSSEPHLMNEGAA